MTTHETIQASGIYPMLRNPEAEKFAQDLANVIHDKTSRQALFAQYLAAHPELKRWEADALKGRAMTIARNNPEIIARVLAMYENHA